MAVLSLIWAGVGRHSIHIKKNISVAFRTCLAMAMVSVPVGISAQEIELFCEGQVAEIRDEKRMPPKQEGQTYWIDFEGGRVSKVVGGEKVSICWSDVGCNFLISGKTIDLTHSIKTAHGFYIMDHFELDRETGEFSNFSQISHDTLPAIQSTFQGKCIAK